MPPWHPCGPGPFPCSKHPGSDHAERTTLSALRERGPRTNSVAGCWAQGAASRSAAVCDAALTAGERSLGRRQAYVGRQGHGRRLPLAPAAAAGQTRPSAGLGEGRAVGRAWGPPPARLSLPARGWRCLCRPPLVSSSRVLPPSAPSCPAPSHPRLTRGSSSNNSSFSNYSSRARRWAWAASSCRCARIEDGARPSRHSHVPLRLCPRVAPAFHRLLPQIRVNRVPSRPQVNTGGSGGEDDASSRASSPTKSPLGLGSTPFLDAQDQPLARQPPGARATGRASQQGLGSGRGQSPFDGAAAEQPQRMRPASPLGRRPGLPNWQELAEQEGLAAGGGDGVPAAGLSGGRGGTPPAGMFGGAPGGGGMFGAAPGGNPSGGAVPRGLFGNSAAPSDPVTYQMQAALDKDGVPNLGEVQDEQPGAPTLQSPMGGQQPQWHIPAVHTHGATPGSGGRARRGGGGPGTPGVSQGVGKRGLLDKPKPGAAFKLGKRQAYTKYLAYEVGWGEKMSCWSFTSRQITQCADVPPASPSLLGWPLWPVLSLTRLCRSHCSAHPRLAGLLAAVPGGAAGGQQPHGRHLPDQRLHLAEEGAGPGAAVPHAVCHRPLALHPGRHAVCLVRCACLCCRCCCLPFHSAFLTGGAMHGRPAAFYSWRCRSSCIGCL